MAISKRFEFVFNANSLLRQLANLISIRIKFKRFQLGMNQTALCVNGSMQFPYDLTSLLETIFRISARHDFWSASLSSLILTVYNGFLTINVSTLKYNIFPTPQCIWFGQNITRSTSFTFLKFPSLLSLGELFIVTWNLCGS